MEGIKVSTCLNCGKNNPGIGIVCGGCRSDMSMNPPYDKTIVLNPKLVSSTDKFTPNSDVTTTLNERGRRYGEFRNHAFISQVLKDIVKQHGSKLAPIHQEALDMIMHKIARILNGDPNYADSWHDIAGYAVLVEQHINNNKSQQSTGDEPV